MSAVHVIVRPRPELSPSAALAPIYGLIDLVVDGVNLTARVGEGAALLLLAETAEAVVDITTGRIARKTVHFYAEEQAWELSLEADGEELLLSVYRTGPSTLVAVHERRVSALSFRKALVGALDEARIDGLPGATQGALYRARTQLNRPWPSFLHPKREHRSRELSARLFGDLKLSLKTSFRLGGSAGARPGPEAELERADLHSLLALGQFVVTSRGRSVSLGPTHVFLFVERLVQAVEDLFDAWQTGRPLLRRVEISGARLTLRRGVGEGPLTLSLCDSRTGSGTEPVTLPEVEHEAFVPSVICLARALCAAFVRYDPSQDRNLRLKALSRSVEQASLRYDDVFANDSMTNHEPESYRSFGLPQKPHEVRGRWEHGGKMRFLPRWVATVPSIDLSATFLCGERLICGSHRETACLERTTGALQWRLGTSRAANVVTPSGLVRLHPDGQVHLHELETGRIRLSTRIAPRALGGASGAVVNAPGLPKLLVLAEGDRSVTALDLVSGDVLWRYTAKRPGAFKVRRAGKLVLVAGGDSALVALDVTQGHVVWRVRDRLPFTGDLAIDHDAVFATLGGPIGPSRLCRLDVWTGEVHWTKLLSERPLPAQPPLLTPTTVVVPTRDRRGSGACALSRESGEPVWEQAPGLASPTSAFLAVDDSVVINSAAGTLFCLDASTGALSYQHVFPRHVLSDQPRRLEPVLRSGALFVPQHQVHVVRPRDGEILGTVPSDLIPDLLRVDERCNVYLAEESGHLAAFGVAPRLTLVRG